VNKFQPKLTPTFVMRALNLTLPSALLASFDEHSLGYFLSVVTDSRKISADCLFVALKGDHFDAHDFIPQAISAGAKGIICRRGTVIEHPGSALIFYVEDTLQAFRSLAHCWRKEFSCPVIVVAGSVGKTTTKEILTAILHGKYSSVLKTQGSQNGFVGIPMTLLELRSEHEAAVIEVGIDDIGAMKGHMELVSATASVLTTIGAEHLEKLQDIPTVAREEGMALSMVALTGGLVAINLDDSWIKPHAKTIRDGKKITYSLSENSQASLQGRYAERDNELVVSEHSYQLPLPGAHNALNTLAAIAIATGLGLTEAEIDKGLGTFKPIYGRSELKDIGSPGKTIHVLCDYYNANPDSMRAGIELLSQIAKKSHSKNKFACLADMLELGSGEERFHRELSAPIVASEIGHVYLFGTRMKWLEDELQKRGYSGELRHFDQHSAISDRLAEILKPGDSVLIKGSHSMKMEEVKKLLEVCLVKS
jgi:UDP-N-acetylmuramoyl-tripeptide--D-alanyl-D-alanine ligase